MTGGFWWSLYAAVVLFSMHAAHSHRSLQGFFCLNDFVRNVSCTWRRSPSDSSADCWITGVKTTYFIKENKKYPQNINRSCKVKQHGEFPGCTFSFDTMFNRFEILPNISVRCNSTLVKTYANYSPKNYIKMHPPGAPNVSSNANVTIISWSPGSPRSQFFKSFNFEVQLKHSHQSWNEVQSHPTQDQVLLIWKKLRGRNQVRVRVKPYERNNSHWSDWSPTTSWAAPDTEPLAQEAALILDWSLLLCLVLILGLASASFLALYRCCIRKRLMREKPVPNPSKYFCTLHSVHEGNLKKWLNPLAASESFFVAHPREDISAIEVCDSWDAAPSTSPGSSSTTALLHFRQDPSSDTGSPVNLFSSSSSSSCFSNMGYFMSTYNSSSAQMHSSPYFSYQCSVLSPHKKLHLSLCRPFNSSSIYESLRREPQSPDSGFGIGQFDDRDMEDNVLDDNQSFPLLLHLPFSGPSFSPTPSPHPSGLSAGFVNQVLEEDAPITASPAASENLSAWPVAGPMCRASSLPVDSCKTGYLTIKELQTTFSNKSI